MTHRVSDHLTKAKAAAIAAVEVYNRPGNEFRTAHYVVLIILAWTAVFHATFYKRGIRPWYRKKNTGKSPRYQRVDGEPKHWELSECLQQFYQDKNPPERKNLDFLIGLRNKIEHRHLPELDAGLYGECQAALLNFEDLMVSEFGRKYSMSASLAVSLQFTSANPVERQGAIKKLITSSAKDILDYVSKFRGGLPQGILNDMRYSFSVFLIPKTANRASAGDMAVEFIPYDPGKPEEMAKLRAVTAIVKEKKIPVANLESFRVGEVIRSAQEHIPYLINHHVHTRAWRHFKVRPRGGSAAPERTQSQYCVYDRAHGDYLYTSAWIDLLTRTLREPKMYELIVGKPPRSTRFK